mgnify:CR=1 FL=1
MSTLVLPQKKLDMSKDPNFSGQPIFRQLLNFINKKKNVKSFLLDQKFVSGIGNIYANEILFYCKINPFKKTPLRVIYDHEDFATFVLPSRRSIINHSKIY